MEEGNKSNTSKLNQDEYFNLVEIFKANFETSEVHIWNWFDESDKRWLLDNVVY